MFERNLSEKILESLTDNPVVLLAGPRQVGKTTLIKQLAKGPYDATYLTLDSPGVLSAAREDPEGFLAGFDGSVILDEIQRAPELLVAIKAAVDEDRRPGRFLLAGSTNVLFLPKVSESLAGRMEIHTLWGFSQGELEGVKEGFVDALFKARWPRWQPSKSGADWQRRALRGGYPEMVSRATPSRRKAWFTSYQTAILQRDVRDLANIDGLLELPRLLATVGARAANLLNHADISRDCKLAQSTLRRYMALLNMVYLTVEMQAWSANLTKRLTKAPKLMISDSGLLANLLGLSEKNIETFGNQRGQLLENFIVMELKKQVGWSQTQPMLYHFRTQKGQEIDVVLEDELGRLVAIEIKASGRVRSDDFKSMRMLQHELPEKFHRGVVLYNGKQVIPFGANLHALPMDALWTLGAKSNQRPL